MSEPAFVIILTRDIQLLIDFIRVEAQSIPLRPRTFDVNIQTGLRRSVHFRKERIDPAGMVVAIAVAAIVNNQPKFVQSGHIRRQRDRLFRPFDFQLRVQRLPCVRRQSVHFRQRLGARLLPTVRRPGNQTSAYRQQYQ